MNRIDKISIDYFYAVSSSRTDETEILSTFFVLYIRIICGSFCIRHKTFTDKLKSCRKTIDYQNYYLENNKSIDDFTFNEFLSYFKDLQKIFPMNT